MSSSQSERRGSRGRTGPTALRLLTQQEHERQRAGGSVGPPAAHLPRRARNHRRPVRDAKHTNPNRNQRKKKALAEARERCSQLAAENASLVQQLDEQRREGYTVTELFRSEVLAKNTQIAQLQVGTRRPCLLARGARNRSQPATLAAPHSVRGVTA